MFGDSGGTPNPADPTAHLSHTAVVIDSGILVLREGLETILVLAVLTASMRGADTGYRRPLAAGAGLAFGAAVVTWFAAIAVTDAVGPGSLDLQAATGLLAIVVLLVVMNWFFHKVYWTGWISHHNKRRKALTRSGRARPAQDVLGLVAARLHLGLPRGLRGRPVPAEPAAALRLRRRARGRGPRAWSAWP